MKRNMVFKGVVAKGLPEGNVRVNIGLEAQVSPDMARDILLEVGDMLDKEVSCEIELVQGRMNLKK